MIYQIYYDKSSLQEVSGPNQTIRPCGVYSARQLPRPAGHIFDDEKSPNLTNHNTLCEWRVLYYIWKHYPSPWVGFTSWQHDGKKFKPQLSGIDRHLCEAALKYNKIIGFCNLPLKSLIRESISKQAGVTLKTQFLQFSMAEKLVGIQFCDIRNSPLGRYHHITYWDFVMQEYRSLYGADLEKELNFEVLGKIDALHTWCNAFVARWDYFNEYMTRFTPIVMAMLDHFGSHPTDLELAYICERLIILNNYIKYTDNEFRADSIKRSIEETVTCNVSGGNGIHKKHHDFSIITCSVDNDKFRRFRKNVMDVFGNHAELIRISDAKSIAEGYNRGISLSNGNTVIFCHDDIEFLNSECVSWINADLKEFDVVGVAGTSRLIDGKWLSSGQPYVHGQVIHPKGSEKNGYTLCVYGLGRDAPLVGGIQALDGLFFAVKRKVVEKVQFDEKSFDGFHLYDLDFTFSAYLRGFRIAVDQRILVLHGSSGNYDATWKYYADRFCEKFTGQLVAGCRQSSPVIRGIFASGKDTLKKEMLSSLTADRLYLEKNNGKEPKQFILLRANHFECESMELQNPLKLPLTENSANFLSMQKSVFAYAAPHIILAEMFRVTRHGAVIELVDDWGSSDHADNEKRKTADSLRDIEQLPREIRFENYGMLEGALLLLGHVKDSNTVAKTYYQSDKHIMAN